MSTFVPLIMLIRSHIRADFLALIKAHKIWRIYESKAKHGVPNTKTKKKLSFQLNSNMGS